MRNLIAFLLIITCGIIVAAAQNQPVDTTSSPTFTAVSGNGAGLTSLPAGQLTGSLADARLSANVPLLNGSQTFSGTVTHSGTENYTNNVTVVRQLQIQNQICAFTGNTNVSVDFTFGGGILVLTTNAWIVPTNMPTSTNFSSAYNLYILNTSNYTVTWSTNQISSPNLFIAAATTTNQAGQNTARDFLGLYCVGTNVFAGFQAQNYKP